MKRNVLDNVFINYEDKVLSCVIHQTDILDNKYLVCAEKENESFIVDEDDMFDTYEECYDMYCQKCIQKFSDYELKFDSIESIVAYFICKDIANGAQDTLEITAAIEKSSEFLNMDMGKYIEVYMNHMKQDNAQEIAI